MNYEFLNKQGMFLRAFDSISESDYYKKVTPELGYQHKIGHIQKVMLFSQIIAIQENLNEMQMRILLAAAAFHDSGREKDRDDGEHGRLSAEVAGEYFTKNKINPFGIAPEDIGIVQTAIAYHVVDEEPINVPRDREATFEPQAIPKRTRDVSGIEDKVLSMYAKGMSQRDIASTIEDIYGFNISAETISEITDKVLEEVQEWQNRPLKKFYTFMFVDCMYVSIKKNMKQKIMQYIQY